MDKDREGRTNPQSDSTYPSDMEGERREPEGTGHNKPKPSDAPSSTNPVDVGKKNREKPIND
ncbi:hypothetical protein [Paracoccus sp. KR1-242]|uniref:hypothetical protein n=1 Tax=Paracoccus sp. KR1-242 TaxID=3410028 RepID=UPI003C087B67